MEKILNKKAYFNADTRKSNADKRRFTISKHICDYPRYICENLRLQIAKDRNLTDFEKKVYLAVSRIPAGKTRSYKWVAQKIGRPKASRAVGNALNKNPYTGIVPCHRVIKSDGSLGGFARGAKRKKEMLANEGASFYPTSQTELSVSAFR